LTAAIASHYYAASRQPPPLRHYAMPLRYAAFAIAAALITPLRVTPLLSRFSLRSHTPAAAFSF